MVIGVLAKFHIDASLPTTLLPKSVCCYAEHVELTNSSGCGHTKSALLITGPAASFPTGVTMTKIYHKEEISSFNIADIQ